MFLRIAELEKQLTEREQETKDLEVKLFESSLGRSKLPSFDDEPLPAHKANRTLFKEDTTSCPPMATPNRDEDTSRRAIADRYKGSSIAFDYAPSPPEQRKRVDSFKTPQIQRRSTVPAFGQQDEDQCDAKRLEEVIKQREGDINGLRLELASAQSEMEQLRKGGGGSQGQMSVELEKERVRVAELESRLVKVQQDAECKLHNSEAARSGMETKLRSQEKELRAEAGEAQGEAARLAKQLEEVEKRLEQEGKASRLTTDCLKAQMEKSEASKR